MAIDDRCATPVRQTLLRKSAAEDDDHTPIITAETRKPEIRIWAKLRRKATIQIALCKSRAQNSPQMRDSRYRKYDPSSSSSLVLSGTRTRSPRMRVAVSFLIL